MENPRSIGCLFPILKPASKLKREYALGGAV
jgi:hypothetical protein